MISWLYSGIAAVGMLNALSVSGQTTSNNQAIPEPIHESQAESLDQWLNQGSSEYVRKLQEERGQQFRLSSRGASSGSAIQDQIDLAAEGSTVTISSGIYRERIVVNKALTIVGNGDVTFLPPDDETTGSLVTISSSDVTLSKLNVSSARGGGVAGSGIYVNGTDLSNITFENVSSSQNSGNGVYVRVNGSVKNFNFTHFKAELNELGGVWFGQGSAGSNGGHRIDTINFVGDGSTPNFSQNGTTGVSIRMFKNSVESTDEFDFIGPIKFDEVVFEANYGVAQVIVESPTAEVDFLGCRFHGGPNLDYQIGDLLSDTDDMSQYGVIIIGELDPKNYKSIPPVRFLRKNNKANAFDGIYWFGAINFLGWNDLAKVSFGDSAGSWSTGVNISANMRGGSIGYWFGFVKASGADGTLNLEGLLLGNTRLGTYDFIMGANPFDPNLDKGTHKKSTLNVDASNVIYEISRNHYKKFEELDIDEKFKAASLYLNRLNPFYLNETPGGLVQLGLDPHTYYIVPGVKNNFQEIINAIPGYATVYIQAGEYQTTTAELKSGSTYYFQGGVGAREGQVDLGVSLRSNGARVLTYHDNPVIFGSVGGLIDFEIGSKSFGVIGVEDAFVFVDDNGNGVFDIGEPFDRTDVFGVYRIPYSGPLFQHLEKPLEIRLGSIGSKSLSQFKILEPSEGYVRIALEREDYFVEFLRNPVEGDIISLAKGEDDAVNFKWVSELSEDPTFEVLIAETLRESIENLLVKISRNRSLIGVENFVYDPLSEAIVGFGFSSKPDETLEVNLTGDWATVDKTIVEVGPIVGLDDDPSSVFEGLFVDSGFKIVKSVPLEFGLGFGTTPVFTPQGEAVGDPEGIVVNLALWANGENNNNVAYQYDSDKGIANPQTNIDFTDSVSFDSVYPVPLWYRATIKEGVDEFRLKHPETGALVTSFEGIFDPSKTGKYGFDLLVYRRYNIQGGFFHDLNMNGIREEGEEEILDPADLVMVFPSGSVVENQVYASLESYTKGYSKRYEFYQGNTSLVRDDANGIPGWSSNILNPNNFWDVWLDPVQANYSTQWQITGMVSKGLNDGLPVRHLNASGAGVFSFTSSDGWTNAGFDELLLGVTYSSKLDGKVLIEEGETGGTKNYVGRGTVFLLQNNESRDVVLTQRMDLNFSEDTEARFNFDKFVSPGSYVLGFEPSGYSGVIREILESEPFNVVSGQTIDDLEIRLLVNPAPVIEDQLLGEFKELVSAGRVVGSVVASDPEQQDLTWEIVSGNLINNPQAILNDFAWKYRYISKYLWFDATLDPSISNSSILLQAWRKTAYWYEDLEPWQFQNIADVFWMLPTGEIYKTISVQPNFFLPNVDQSLRTDILGDFVTNIGPGYFNDIPAINAAAGKDELIIDPELQPFQINPNTGEITLVLNDLTLEDQPGDSFKLAVRVTDEEGASDEGLVEIRMVPANLAPEFVTEDPVFTVGEGIQIGSSIGEAVAATDPDGPVTDLSYSIQSISTLNNQLIELDQLYRFIDTSGGSFSFNAKGKNEKWLYGSGSVSRPWVYIIENEANGLAEMYSAGQVNGVAVIDEGNDPLIMTMTPNFYDNPAQLILFRDKTQSTSFIEIDEETGQLSVLENGNGEFNPGLGQEIELVVRVTDQGTPVQYTETTVTIGINPEYGPPVVADQSFSVDENSPEGAAVGSVIATDPEGASDIVRFEMRSISAGTNVSGIPFVINETTGALTVAEGAELDFESASSYTFLVRVTDLSLRWGEGTITVNLQDIVEDVPVRISDAIALEQIAGEANSIQFTVELDFPAPEDIDFNYNIITGTAAENDMSSPLTGLFTIQTGESSFDLSIGINPDLIAESEETFVINIALEADTQSAVIETGSATGTIVDDDTTLVIDYGPGGPGSFISSEIVSQLENSGLDFGFLSVYTNPIDPDLYFTSIDSDSSVSSSYYINDVDTGGVELTYLAPELSQLVDLKRAVSGLDLGGVAAGKTYRVSVSSPVDETAADGSVLGRTELEVSATGVQRKADVTFASNITGLGTDFATDLQGQQMVDPTDVANEGKIYWHDIGVFTPDETGGLVSVKSKLFEDANGGFLPQIADAIRFEPIVGNLPRIDILKPRDATYNEQIEVVIRLSEAPQEGNSTRVAYQVNNAGGALSGDSMVNGSLEFAAGETEKVVALTTAASPAPSQEPTREYQVKLGPVLEGFSTIGDYETNGEVAPAVFDIPEATLVGASGAIESAGSLDYSVQLDRPAPELIKIQYRAIALSGGGFVNQQGEIIFEQGSTNAGFTVEFQDDLIQNAETRQFRVNILAGAQFSLGTSIIIVNLEDDEAPLIVDAPDSSLYSEKEFIRGSSGWSTVQPGFGGQSRTIVGVGALNNAQTAAEWKIEGLEVGKTYQVLTTWKQGPNLSKNAPFKVLVENPENGQMEIIGEKRIDQTREPSDFRTDSGGQFINNGDLGWAEVGIFTANEDTWWIQLWDNANGFVVADSVRVAEVEPPFIAVIEDQTMNAGETTQIPIQIGHLNPDMDLTKVRVVDVQSSSELLIPNTPTDGAGITVKSIDPSIGSWELEIASIGLRTGSVEITVVAEDESSLKARETFKIDIARSRVLFDMGTVTQNSDALLADNAIAVSKNTLFNESTLYGWEENAGFQGRSFADIESDLILVDSIVGPLVGVFKIGGLQPNTDYLISAQLGRAGTRTTGVEVINLNDPNALGARATHFFEETAGGSRQVTKNILSRSDAVGQIRLGVQPYHPDPLVTAKPYFALSGLEFSLLNDESTNNGDNAPLSFEEGSAGSLELFRKSQIRSRANAGVTPVVAPLWIDNGGDGFDSTGDWVPVEGQGVERDLLYDISQTENSSSKWAFRNLASGSYRIAVSWAESSNRATDTTWTINHQGESFGPFTLDQTTSPSDVSFGGYNWGYLTPLEWNIAFDAVLPGLTDEDGNLIPLDYNDFVVEMNGSSTGFAIADAVRLEPVNAFQLIAEIPSTFTQLEGNVISGEARIPLTLNTEPVVLSSVLFEIVPESATALSDFAPIEGTIAFDIGQTEAELLIPIFGDTNVEPDETFLVRWTDPNGLALSNTETRVIIVNDDGGVSTAPTETQISVKSGIVEGATVFLDANGNGVFDGAEVFAVTDSTGLASFVSFASQAQGGAVAQGGVDRVTGDSMTLTLSSPQGASVIHSLTTILNWKLDQNPEAASSTVKDDLLGSFGIGADYRLLTQNPIARYRATFSANNARALVAQFGMETVAQALVAYMNAAGDTVTSGDVFEGLATGLSGAFDWNSVADWEGLIQSIETSTGVDINDGHATVIAEAMAELSGKAQVVLVDSSPALSSARLEALSDLAQLRAYVRRVMVRDLADLGSGTINAEQWIGDNSGAFLTEVIASQITNRSVGTAQVPGALALSRLDYSLFESEGRVGIEVVRSRGALGTVGATLVVKEGTATFENDLVEATSAIEFGFGETGTKTFFVNVQNDVFEESDEMFSIELVNPVGGAALDLPGLASVMIEDDDSVEILQTIELQVSMNAAIHEVFLTWPSFLQGIVELESKSELSAQAPWEVVDISTAADSAGFTTLAVDTVGQLDRVYRLKISIPLQSLQLRNGSLELVTSREAVESLVLETQAAGSAEWVEVPLEDVWEDPFTGQTIIPAPVNEGGTKYRLRALK